jgi:single-stranded DNA-binding protein
MTAYALISGIIFRPPLQKTAKSGKPYTTCTIKVTGADDNASADFWNVLTFSESGQIELLRLEVGDAVSVRGKLKLEIFTKDNEPRISRSIFADAALGLRPAPRTLKPKAAKEASTSQGLTRQSIIPPSSESPTERVPSSFYSDDLPF